MKKKGTILILTGLLLIAAALSITAYNFWDSARAGNVSNALLQQVSPLISTDPIPPDGRPNADEVEYPDYVLNPDMEMPVVNVDGNEYIGVLNLPSLDKQFPVLSAWSYPNLKIAPCRFSGSAYRNDLVICAHNYSPHFGTLRNLSYGDTVEFTDMDGNLFTYEVVEIETLQPTQVSEMTAGEYDLTLFTCTVGGQSRVTVRCNQVSSGSAAVDMELFS